MAEGQKNMKNDPLGLIGATLSGRYEVQAVLGVGGMSVVYRAYDVQMERIVALKVLLREYSSDSDYSQRFLGEARKMAGLRHPNILDVYDYIRDEAQNITYIVMEYAGHGTVRDLLRKRGHLGSDEAISIAVYVLDALTHIHKTDGMVHRDIKVTNILLASDGYIKLADFGIAKSLQDPDLTQRNMLLGSACYTAPERFNTSTAGLDPRSDIYSVGIVLYEMLSGHVPFNGELASLPSMHAHSPVPPLRPYYPHVSLELERLVFQALAKPPGMRFKTADEMKQKLLPLLSTQAQGVHSETGAALRSEDSADKLPPLHGATLELLDELRDALGSYYSLDPEQGRAIVLYEGHHYTTFAATHTYQKDGQPATKEVAIKVLHRDVDPLARQAFAASISILGGLAHKDNGLVWPRAYSLGSGGAPSYAVMRRLTCMRPTLDRERLIGFGRASGIGLQLAKIMWDLHQGARGTFPVAHGVVAPGNLLLSLTLNSNPQVALVGFSQSRKLTEAPLQHHQHAMLLTAPEDAPYMAPERFAGEPPSVEADIYGLGAVLYGLVSGKPPYLGRTAHEVAKAQAAGLLVPIEQLNPAVPPELAEIIKGAMALREGKCVPSFSNAGEIAAALEEVISLSNKATGPLLPLLTISPNPLDLGTADFTGPSPSGEITVISRSRTAGTIQPVGPSANWLTVHPTTLPPRATTIVHVEVDRTKVPTKGTAEGSISFSVPGMQVVVRVRIRLLTGFDLVIIVDVVGDEATVAPRRSFVQELIRTAETELAKYRELRVALITYADWRHNTPQPGNPITSTGFVTLTSANASAAAIQPVYHERFDWDAALDAALQVTNSLPWGQAHHGVVIVGNRPPHLLRDRTANQLPSPTGIDWRDIWEDMVKRLHLAPVAVYCEDFYWLGKTFPNYAEEHTYKCWQALGSKAYLTLSGTTGRDVIRELTRLLY